MKYSGVALCVLIGISLFLNAKDEFSQNLEKEPLPWTTGPLIAPAGVTVPKGDVVVQPYFSVGLLGFYNNHWKTISQPNFYVTSSQLFVEAGITPFMDVQIFPQVLYNTSQGQSSLLFADFPLTFNFQLVPTDRFQWFPGIKLALTETFPTGNYQKLNPKKHGTDVSGAGSFATTPALVFYKVYPLYKNHFLTLTASAAYTMFAPVSLKGLSAYGGNRETKGTIYPGGLFTTIISFEYTLTQNWVLALDNVYVHENKGKFRGNPGKSTPQEPLLVQDPSAEQLSFAPAIEYNFSNNFGCIAGVYFTAAGRNAFKFCNGIVSIVLTY